MTTDLEDPRSPAGRYEFHVSRVARDHYGFDQALFSSSGNVVIPNFRAARLFAEQMNELRDPDRYPERVIQAGELNAMGLIDEILHHVVELYRRQVNPSVMADALAALGERIEPDRLERTIEDFVRRFPPLAVYRGEQDVASYLAASSDGMSNREVALEELLLLWLANANPAFARFGELFDEAPLAETTAYREVVAGLQAFFASQPGFGAEGQSLIALLRAPALAVPESLAGQLRYIRERWALVLARYLDRLVVSLDVLNEEEVALWMRTHPTPGPGAPTHGPGLGLGGGEQEYERFSQDRDWMPKVVLLAKTTYVWLDQLSKRYGRRIGHLDEIPDEELDRLARQGFTGLWLIGLWERSRASQKIKQWRGNPEAAASAYSLMDYTIAEELGGEAALQQLRERCRARGIRLSSDMVPNHMGIDSRWVAEQPDWFLQLPEPPYPSYSYSGGNLSDDPRITVQIEDHYWSDSDAAVVFKRTDNASGQARYIYHGNDGTSMPWNDTAQLDYLKADVREAVIQTILEVARKFPIIRFDAAMTLARRHIQRLWYPEPGQGGAIPSRAEHATPARVFEERMPHEFWREVVDRVAAEVPDTLLLAEAFWLMEGYFVRTLGMHRVYNSAFMNMLRDEDNAGYRRVMKDTMEFDPEILKRFVNFMSNPDERTAVDQFGRGDKYFGVATLMATMPGLPMIGHGQVEGFVEKYGMEYRRAYRDEQPDGWLVERHEREIFPLFHRRWLFAEVRDFLLYDVFDPGGWVNEDVFAYSNRAGDQRGLVVYHNRYASARGWVKTSASYSEPDGSGGRRIVRRSLGEGLGLHADDAWFTIFREQRSGLEFIRNSGGLVRDGLFVELHAYQCQVFLDFREVQDGVSGQYRRLAERLDGAGVPSIDSALRELQLLPLHDAARALAADGALRRLTELGVARAVAACGGTMVAERPATNPPAGQRAEGESELGAPAPGGPAAPSVPAEPPLGADADPEPLLDEVEARAADLFQIAAGLTDRRQAAEPISVDLRRALGAALRLPSLAELAGGAADDVPLFEAAAGRLCRGLTEPSAWAALFGHAVSVGLARAVAGDAAASSLDELQLAPVLAGVFRDVGLDEGGAWRQVALVQLLRRLPYPSQFPDGGPAGRARRLAEALLEDPDVRPYIQVNVWKDVAWFHRESFQQIVWWSLLLDTFGALSGTAAPATGTAAPATGTAAAPIGAAAPPTGTPAPEIETVRRIADAARITTALERGADASGFRADQLPDAAAEAIG